MAAYFTVESLHEKLTFRALQMRLIKIVNERIQNGEFTERGLAKLLGISQPQIHNVLKGARKLRLELADRLLWTFRLTVFDLIEPDELAEQYTARQAVFSQPDLNATPVDTVSLPKRRPTQQSPALRNTLHGI